MYYPYLRGKQAELGALKELALDKKLSRKVIPVIEPIKLTAQLVKFMEVFCEDSRPFYLAMPPQVGMFNRQLNVDYTIQEQDTDAQKKSKKKMQKLKDGYLLARKDSNVRIATFANVVSDRIVNQLIEEGKNNQCIILFRNEGELVTLYEKMSECKFVDQIYFVPQNNFEHERDDKLVLFNDKFIVRRNNAEYVNYPDEFYSRDHLIYQKEGYVGFSDYSIVGEKYTEGGSQPKAHVLHIVYPMEPNQEFHIKHFCSDSNKDKQNQDKKFFEAARKVKKWNNMNPDMDTMGIQEIISNYDAGHYPGLTIEKKMSFMNHFEFVSRYLDGQT